MEFLDNLHNDCKINKKFEKTKFYRNCHSLKIIAFFIIIVVFPIFVVKIYSLYKTYSYYNAGIYYLKSGKYVDAVNNLALAKDYKDAKSKLKIASEHVFGKLDDCLKQIDMEMVICPAEINLDVKNKDKSKKRKHEAKINSPFAIGKYEVTLAQYLLIMKRKLTNNTSLFKPVNHITWNEAKEFCEKLNKMFADKLPKNYKFDLPTNLQWEYACRSGKNSKFYVGPTEGNSDEVAWYVNNSDDDIQLVGQKKPNDWEIYDMHGNVWEWCNNSCEKCEYLLANATDPTKIKTPICHILRGGSFCDSIDKSIIYDNTTISFKSVGFRLAFVPCK